MEDIKTALKSMGYGLLAFVKVVAKAAFVVLGSIIIFGVFTYLVMNYFLYILAFFGVFLVAVWFYIELLEARTIREYEELKKIVHDNSKL